MDKFTKLYSSLTCVKYCTSLFLQWSYPSFKQQNINNWYQEGMVNARSKIKQITSFKFFF